MEAAGPAIEVRGLVKTFRKRSGELIRAVDGISFAVQPGEIFGLLGPNGAGKSTIVRILTTITRATEGSAQILGHDVARDPLAVRQKIAAVLQETAVELLLSVRDNLRIYGRLHHLSFREIRERSARLIDQFDLGDKLDEKVQDLSLGLRRRLQVAKVFMVDVPVVFLDEATTGMDPIIKRETLDAILRESHGGRTIFLTTQILQEAEELCDRMMIINHGQAIASGDLTALQRMTTRLFRVSIVLPKMEDALLQSLRALAPVSLNVDHHTVEMTFKGAEGEILQQLAAWSTQTRIERFEIRGADLEDIFIELLQEKE